MPTGERQQSLLELLTLSWLKTEIEKGRCIAHILQVSSDTWRMFSNFKIDIYWSSRWVLDFGKLSSENIASRGLLSFFQCVAGMILSTVSYDFILDASRDEEKREQIFRYYGTFTRATLTMFEILSLTPSVVNHQLFFLLLTFPLKKKEN